MLRMNLGDFQLTSVSDGHYYLDGGAFFGVVPKTLWERKVPVDDKNRVPTGLNSLVVQTGTKTILVETGIGNKLREKILKVTHQPAKLLENLAAAGFAPDDIDIVINTHLHYDHCGWNTVRQGERFIATFPRAKYYVQEGEWRHAQQQHERDAISYLTENYDPLIESGQMELVRGDREIIPGVSLEVFPGHTENMQAVIFKSGGKAACYISDLIPTRAHTDLTWVMAFDLAPIQTIESRKRYYARALPEQWLTIFTHDHEIPWAYLERDEKGKIAARANS
jgi:glyoxylase-like metal-dependent hydrolase (beta-lactamase superfamily II)